MFFMHTSSGVPVRIVRFGAFPATIAEEQILRVLPEVSALESVDALQRLVERA